MKLPTILLLTFMITDLVNSLNILVPLSMPSTSHYKSFSRLFKSLAEKGHNVTVISYFPNDKPLQNFRDIDIGNLHIFLNELIPFSQIERIRTNKFGRYILYLMEVAQITQSSCDKFFKSKAVRNFLQEENNYDIILVEDFFSECLWPLAQKYKCPVIRFLSHTLLAWNGKQTGNPLASAYVPNNYVIFNVKMFWDRLENTLVNLWQTLYFELSIVPKQKEVAKRYVDVDETTFDQEFFNASLVLMNTHFVLNNPRPLVPNMIEVGGIHIGESRRLPKELERWISDSENGVIYFCLGSVVQGHTMPEEKRKAFINAFKRLPQRVIWKWENETMDDKAENIMIGKWLPQFDILSHPNVKAFISHGGLLGTMEAVHCGVPMMVMPQFGDQHSNAKALESVGGGVILSLSDANEETIYQSLKKILEPSFQAQAKELSERFRDRPMPPLETAIYWVEYVARHKGAHFMKTAAVNMPFYQYYLLDVIAFIIFILLLFFYMSYLSLKFILRKIGISSYKTIKYKKS